MKEVFRKETRSGDEQWYERKKELSKKRVIVMQTGREIDEQSNKHKTKDLMVLEWQIEVTGNGRRKRENSGKGLIKGKKKEFGGREKNYGAAEERYQPVNREVKAAVRKAKEEATRKTVC